MTGMGWQLSKDADEFLRASGDFLEAKRVEHNFALTFSSMVREDGTRRFAEPPQFCWLPEDGRIVAAAVVVPPVSVTLFGPTADAARSLAKELIGTRPSVTHVVGEQDAVGAFVAEWGLDATGQRGQLLYRLGELRPARPAEGFSRPAEEQDFALLAGWAVDGFGDSAEEDLRRRMDYRGVWVWEVAGEPVSMATLSRSSAGLVRIGVVYTPPEHRGHGYAAAITEQVARAALAAGNDEVLLFTDEDNPTSNALYQRLGFELVSRNLWAEIGAAS
ncbi:GNAT family N-acetyltransferase [Pseudonocardiaceae bacterium YIM PH 21723]|nr:GNAT family N-acetyltransferase [Pseudonocardiaceae bacterium YIM PH 21723]